MRLNRRFVVVAAGALVLAAGGAGIAYGVGGDSEEQLTGPSAEHAKRAALDAVGGGTVRGVERQDGDGEGAYEVEVERTDGSQVEVHLDGDFNVVGRAADDDGPGDRDGPGEDD